MELKEGKKHTCGLRRPFGVAGMMKARVQGKRYSFWGTLSLQSLKDLMGNHHLIPFWGHIPKRIEEQGLKDTFVHLSAQWNYSQELKETSSLKCASLDG